MTVICIIPARGGSKRIPRKNIKEFCNKPIIAYSIEAALGSGIFDEVMVSTDDNEIASIAREYGAILPFMRSVKASDDYATTMDVINEVINEYRKLKKEFTAICCLYPTAPFVTVTKLITANELLNNASCKVVVPVVKYSYPVQRSFKVINQRLEMIYPEEFSSRSQDLEPIYHDAGQFYFMEKSFLENDVVLFGENTLPLIVSELEVQDLDTLNDWSLAEIKYRLMFNK